MSVVRIDAAAVLATLQGRPGAAHYDAIIDARSPAEFALDALPGAVNWPSLNDEQRHEVGTLYKQVSTFEARKRGAAWVAHNIAQHLRREMPGLPRSWKPLVYCWRGGQRSGALALVLSQIGFEVTVLQGGYRSFRQAVVQALMQAGQGLRWHVLCGKTGTGKSRLLQVLRDQGAQVLDLEALASHRGSVLGDLPSQPQPSQKRFESMLWLALSQLDASRTVFVESESAKVGQLRLPVALVQAIRQAPCTQLEMPVPARVALLMADYRHLVDDVEALCQRLWALRELRGASTVQRWQDLARAGHTAPLVQELLEQHYDPIYTRSMARNFSQLPSAGTLALADASEASWQQAAQALARGQANASAQPTPEAPR